MPTVQTSQVSEILIEVRGIEGCGERLGEPAVALGGIHGKGLAGVGKRGEKMPVYRIPERRWVGAQVRGEGGEIPDSHVLHNIVRTGQGRLCGVGLASDAWPALSE